RMNVTPAPSPPPAAELFYFMLAGLWELNELCASQACFMPGTILSSTLALALDDIALASMDMPLQVLVCRVRLTSNTTFVVSDPVSRPPHLTTNNSRSYVSMT